MHQTSQTDNIISLEEKIASHPGSLEDICALASAYEDQGRWKDAVEMYQTAIAVDPANADLHNNMGTAYEEMGDLECAEKAYQEAIALRPEDSMTYYNLGSLYEEQQRKQEAIRASSHLSLS
jgi:tetratricopeptide (TPR) repeat protein